MHLLVFFPYVNRSLSLVDYTEVVEEGFHLRFFNRSIIFVELAERQLFAVFIVEDGIVEAIVLENIVSKVEGHFVHKTLGIDGVVFRFAEIEPEHFVF